MVEFFDRFVGYENAPKLFELMPHMSKVLEKFAEAKGIAEKETVTQLTEDTLEKVKKTEGN